MKVQEEKNEELTMKWKREIAVANGDKSTALAELEQVWRGYREVPLYLVLDAQRTNLSDITMFLFRTLGINRRILRISLAFQNEFILF